ncbi:MAG: hypothetical protein D6706_09955 [Chloroflexi bacterium]|nr:MAG: hypothetical protein D6706_09955 [Chloroflexota bacterium]
MKHLSYFKWLALAAIADWFISRTVTRAAIHIPKTSTMITIYAVVNQAGQIIGTFTALLTLALVGWLAWQNRHTLWLSITLTGLAGLSLLFLVVVPSTRSMLIYQLLAATVTILILKQREEKPKKLWWQWGQLAVFFPATALLAGLLYQLLPNFYATMNWPGPPPLTGTLFHLGELFVIGSVCVWWWMFGRTTNWQIWVISAVPALFFALSFWHDPAMTGILTIWSTGLTLILPWPVYTVALWLVGVTVLVTWYNQPLIAYAVLLFVAAGYTPQLSTQLFCALLGLWLLRQQMSWSQEGVNLVSPTKYRQQVAI